MELSVHIKGIQVNKYQPSEKSNLMLILLSEAYVLISDPAIRFLVNKKWKKKVSINIVPLVKKTLPTHGTEGRGGKITRSLLVHRMGVTGPLMAALKQAGNKSTKMSPDVSFTCQKSAGQLVIIQLCHF